MDHDSIRQSIAAYALDALEDDERSRIQATLVEHLPGCEECSAMMRDFREVAADLAVGAESRQPPSAAEARLLEAVRGENRSERPVSRPDFYRRRFARGLAAVAAAALVASVGLNAVIASRLHRAERRVDSYSALLDVTSGVDATSVSLRGQSGSVTLAYRPGGKAVLVGSGLPKLQAGKVFELWFLDGRAIPVTTFRAKSGVIVLALESEPSSFRGVAITVENGFVAAPTTEPIYAGTLRA